MRARLADQGEPARPPGEGWRRDTMPPPSPGEAPPGLSAPSEPTGLAGGGEGRAEDDREAADAGATRRPGRAGPTSLGGEATRPYATAFARGVGRGIAGGGVNRIRQRRRDGGGAAAETG